MKLHRWKYFRATPQTKCFFVGHKKSKVTMENMRKRIVDTVIVRHNFQMTEGASFKTIMSIYKQHEGLPDIILFSKD